LGHDIELAVPFVLAPIFERRSFLGILGLLFLVALALAVLPLTNALLVTFGALLVGALLLAPEIAIYLLVFAVPFGSLLPFNVGGANVTAADGLLVLAWGLYLMRGIARRKLELRLPPLALPFVIFILAGALSITVARSFTDSIAELTKWVEMFAAYWLVAQYYDAKNMPRLLAVMFCAGLAEAVLGAYQYYFRVGPEGFLLFGGANLRAYGTFEQPNPYAGYLGLILPLAFGTGLGILFQRTNPFSKWLLALLAGGSFVAMLAALFFSYSRGAWVGVAAALGTTALLVLVRSKRAATLAIVLGLVAFIVIGLGEINLVPNIITERFAAVGDYFNFEDVRGVRANDENFAVVERRAHWQAALGMFQDSPWVGVGLGNYAAAYPQYSLPKWDDPLGHAHNYYLNVLAEAGGIGFLTYILLWGVIFLNIGRATLRSQGWQQGVIAGAFGVLVTLSIHNFFDNLFVHAMYIQVGLTLGIVEAFRAETPTISQP
jgi:putative inorganic carbon (hco3(-)) transporter